MCSSQKFYLCIHCGAQNKALFRIFTKDAITLESCSTCNQIIDKYVEYDFTTILIDILLLKISAYRHVIYNTERIKDNLLRLVALTLLSYSYVEWVYEKTTVDQMSEPIFYELEWGYYVIIVQQIVKATLFTVTFFTFTFLSSKSLNIPKERLDYSKVIQGMGMSYCWNLVTVPSLVWNHYSTYYILSQIAFLISCHHTFLVCIHLNYRYAVITVACAYGVQWRITMWFKHIYTYV